jgi:hypothetical protein
MRLVRLVAKRPVGAGMDESDNPTKGNRNHNRAERDGQRQITLIILIWNTFMSSCLLTQKVNFLTDISNPILSVKSVKSV